MAENNSVTWVISYNPADKGSSSICNWWGPTLYRIALRWFLNKMAGRDSRESPIHQPIHPKRIANSSPISHPLSSEPLTLAICFIQGMNNETELSNVQTPGWLF